MLENDIIEPSYSDWSSPCILVPKPDKSYRFCTDFRKVNSVSITDSFPIPRIDDCIDKIGDAQFVSRFDLLKGYWQVPLTERAKRVSAFVTPDGLFQYKVMPFGMKNAPATFQRLVNGIIADLQNCEGYIDDIITYSDTWEQHKNQSDALFKKLSDATLTVNLMKSEFCHATVEYLGHIVGQGQVKPIKAKVEAIVNFTQPNNKKEMMRFLGMAGYYRKFCPNFSVIANPMTDLLKKDAKFIWSNQCAKAFDKLKAILITSPILIIPDFTKQFKLSVDASDTGAGSVLSQNDVNDIEHPICYFSKKFNRYQKNYSTIEKECLALILSLQHFDFYLGTTLYPVIVCTDHNPLTFIHKMKNKNQRLLRWSLMLQEYNIVIKHIKGRDNVIPDTLSRVNYVLHLKFTLHLNFFKGGRCHVLHDIVMCV
ncbi:retrovirus-related Pol polyprotein from transposon 297 isoform X1 [Patella vulgata]|uniref:retrovirus-related Pol polyprotein from transposon 297 isoform X1 n=1 Tax=Patella vulgata TaxID=6465 RepID=UPI0024A88048|nr:retrovirus-related Pol polyprotein from transposon 297 isoform X1 [Patella vulgata]XP_050402710.2 retrovirus-related Pol polyprotein from transposon 297 isoform X1 [Patella vulgata]XP_050402737.2 retrovirus-related Pol polyprotein from transposon 297 isoform X1 [Patella vulgata]XP_050402742.2 retrovirus-related Pol polyprotein from transposon 297 isoform X1 [Patella vulgata]XP_055956561.1 retrovirus-related Pol polyprotein from transposon 297 isoform X1 [Patella vulgata]